MPPLGRYQKIHNRDKHPALCFNTRKLSSWLIDGVTFFLCPYMAESGGRMRRARQKERGRGRQVGRLAGRELTGVSFYKGIIRALLLGLHINLVMSPKPHL